MPSGREANTLNGAAEPDIAGKLPLSALDERVARYADEAAEIIDLRRQLTEQGHSLQAAQRRVAELETVLAGTRDRDPRHTVIRRLVHRLDDAEIMRFWQAEQTNSPGREFDIATLQALIALRSADYALLVVDDAVARHPKDFYLSALRFDALRIAGDWFEAFRIAIEAHGIEPNHLMVTYDTAVLAIRMRRFSLASELLHKALRRFIDDDFNPSSVFPLQCLLRIYAVDGAQAGPAMRASLEHLAQRGLHPFIEISPFLKRVSSLCLSGSGTSRKFGRVATDPRSAVIYHRDRTQNDRIPGYAVFLCDHPQHHLRLAPASVSGSFGAVWTDDTCYALDHGFHSSLADPEFHIESKAVLTHDEALLGFSMAEGIIYLAPGRPLHDLNEEVLVVPPCHYTNFGHFVHDVLALKYGYDRLKRAVPALKILLLRPFPNEIFSAAFQLVFGADYICIDDQASAYRVRAAHLLTLPHAMWPNEGAVCIAPARYLVKHLRSTPQAPGTALRKIFIARKGTAAGSPAAIYQSIFEELGFEARFIEDYSPADCLAAFGSASHVAGMHGAGLMNFIFAPSGVRVAECKRPGGNWHSIAAFARAVEVDFQTFEPFALDDASFDDVRAQIQDWFETR